ncbi:MAG: carboxypeptidase regulatory-like domain-containing protein [Acidobacteriota bacterium]
MEMTRFLRTALVLAVSIVWLAATATAQSSGTIRGRVTDAGGGIIIGASVVLVDANSTEKLTVTNSEGIYSFANLAPGVYTLRAISKGFAGYENLAEVTAARKEPVEINIQLQVTAEKQEVTVTSDSAALSLSNENNAGALVLKGTDLDALPEDPEDLADALQALAGPSAGPNGAQFYIDGFTGGRMPPRSSIREIRINQNPFSSEFERMGFGRIEILTKPGTDKFQGQAHFGFNDESLNSRHPYAPNRAPYQSRSYGGNISGPLVSKKASFFLDFDRRELDENAIINAQILDSQLNPTRFSQVVLTPQRRLSVSPRFELQINPSHTLVTRYSYSQSRDLNEGIGEFSLLSRAYSASRHEHNFSLTETAVLGPRLINETRLQYESASRGRDGDNTVPTLRVLDAFFGGGAGVGVTFNDQSEWELHNTTSWIFRKHSLKWGARLTRVEVTDVSSSNFAGTFTFGGGLGPQLDATNNPVLDATGKPVVIPVSSLERYRRTLLFQSLGRSSQEIRQLGGGATQFSINGGDPLADVRQVELGLFINDDWTVRPDLVLSLGLRYEAQTNIGDQLDVAPRLSFAWSPGFKAGQRAKTIVRGGYGVFYDRFSESNTLEADRYNGVKQQQFIVSNPDFFPNVPSVQSLIASSRPQSIRRVFSGLVSPYSLQGAISVERQLPKNFTATVSYVNTRRVHDIRSFNVNAPLPGTGQRPLGDVGNVFEYRSDGLSRMNQLMVGLNNRFGRNLTLFGHYSLGKWRNTGESGSGSPLDPYDFSNEYARAGGDVRHRVVFGGSMTLPWGVRLNPFVMATSGRPFNITTGRDTNADTLFTERPTFATDLSRPGVVVSSFGAFDPNPTAGQPVIPRNFGESPGFIMTRLGIRKTFGIGARPEQAANAQAGGPPAGMWAGGGGGGGRDGGHGGGGGGRMGGGGFGAGGGSAGRYNLTLSIDISNVINHTNQGPVIGNLTSPLFGVSNSATAGFGFRGAGGGGGGGGTSSAGNRRVELGLRFSF